MADHIGIDLYDYYVHEFNSLTSEEQDDEGPLLSREEYYEYKLAPVDYFRYVDNSIRPCLEETRLYKLDAHSPQWPRLVELVRSTKPESWSHKFYQDYTVLDGSAWSLDIQIDGKKYSAQGRNAWPNELHCPEGGDLRADIFDLLEKDVEPFRVNLDGVSIKPESDMPEVAKPRVSESEKEKREPELHVGKYRLRSIFSKPLIKRPDVIFYKDKRYVLLSDPIGRSLIDGKLSHIPYVNEAFARLLNIQGRGFCAEWIIDGNQLKILRFIGDDLLARSLTDKIYLNCSLREVWTVSRYEWCRHFSIFSGELKLYQYDPMMRTSVMGWLFGLKDGLTLTVKAGEVVKERASRSFFRPNPFINFTNSTYDAEGIAGGIVAYLFILFLPLWVVKILFSLSFDGFSSLCFYAFQVYWFYGVLNTLEGAQDGKPWWAGDMR